MYELNDLEFLAAIEDKLTHDASGRSIEAYQLERLVRLARLGVKLMFAKAATEAKVATEAGAANGQAKAQD